AVLSTAPESIYWILWMKHLQPAQVVAVCERLLFGQKLITQFRAIAEITHDGEELRNPNTPPSRIVARLDTLNEWGLVALWLNGHPIMKGHIESYVTTWQF
ncbi:MAG TPA: hypothetical protein PLZ51_26065, partial [Aggregatilineales bacterium]|nr:hypothetical protein [Aggregatilineales bacterium]